MPGARWCADAFRLNNAATSTMNATSNRRHPTTVAFRHGLHALATRTTLTPRVVSERFNAVGGDANRSATGRKSSAAPDDSAQPSVAVNSTTNEASSSTPSAPSGIQSIFGNLVQHRTVGPNARSTRRTLRRPTANADIRDHGRWLVTSSPMRSRTAAPSRSSSASLGHRRQARRFREVGPRRLRPIPASRASNGDFVIPGPEL